MVRNLWDNAKASGLQNGLDELVYRSNLIGAKVVASYPYP